MLYPSVWTTALEVSPWSGERTGVDFLRPRCRGMGDCWRDERAEDVELEELEEEVHSGEGDEEADWRSEPVLLVFLSKADCCLVRLVVAVILFLAIMNVFSGYK